MIKSSVKLSCKLFYLSQDLHFFIKPYQVFFKKLIKAYNKDIHLTCRELLCEIKHLKDGMLKVFESEGFLHEGRGSNFSIRIEAFINFRLCTVSTYHNDGNRSQLHLFLMVPYLLSCFLSIHKWHIKIHGDYLHRSFVLNRFPIFTDGIDSIGCCCNINNSHFIEELGQNLNIKHVIFNYHDPKVFRNLVYIETREETRTMICLQNLFTRNAHDEARTNSLLTIYSKFSIHSPCKFAGNEKAKSTSYLLLAYLVRNLVEFIKEFWNGFLRDSHSGIFHRNFENSFASTRPSSGCVNATVKACLGYM